MKTVSTVALLFFTLLCISPSQCAKSLIPLYIWPTDSAGNCNTEWKKVINSAVASSISIIVNPSNGPVSKTVDSWTWTCYDKCIKEARAKGVKVYGYVHTKVGYETGALTGWRNKLLVTNDIDLWGSEYTVDGIFVDETSTRWLLTFENKPETVQAY